MSDDINKLYQIVTLQSEKIDKLYNIINELKSELNKMTSGETLVDSSLDLSEYRIENIVDEYYTEDLFLRGVDGLVDFICNYIVVDDNDKLIYKCIDYGKATFGYVEDNTIKKDLRCKLLLDSLQCQIVKKSNKYYKKIINELYSKENDTKENDDTKENNDTDGDESDEYEDIDDEVDEIIANEIQSISGNNENEIDIVVNNFLEIKRCIARERNNLIKKLCDRLYVK
jgi:hypothetical protein